MSARTAALHTPAELALVAVDDTTGIVTFTAPSKSPPAQPNHTAYDTTTGAIHCDCKAAQCHEDCWHADLVAAAWLAAPAMRDVRWLTDARLVRYGRKTAAMVDTYRARTGRVLPMDAANLVAARSEYRRRQAAALVAELTEGEVPQPLAQSFTLANVWCDLARLAGEELPADALAVVGRALDATIEPVGGRRGRYAEHARQFAPAD